jgi:DNA invertase Pin-like site-specific DNA recombinase
MVVHIYNPSTSKAKAEGSWIQGQPGLYSKTLTQKKKNKPQKLINELIKQD